MTMFVYSSRGQDTLNTSQKSNGSLKFSEEALLKEKSTHIKDTDYSKPKEVMPEFPGGEDALLKYLIQHAKYTRDAKKARVEGKVFTSFTIAVDGSIENIVVERGVHPSLDSVCYKAIQNMPKWTPGMSNGKAVRVRYTVPFLFER